MWLPAMFRALGARNYRLFFFGQIGSLVGTWMQSLALGWLVYRITDSPFMLGVTGFAASIPSLVFAPLTGVVADRFARRSILIITQTLFLVQSAVLGILVLYGITNIFWILVLSGVYGVILAFDAPARHSFVIEMVDRKDDLSNAIALNSAVFHASRFIGPVVAGFIIARWNEAACFFVNSASYIFIIIVLLFMKVRPYHYSGEGSFVRRFVEGITYIRNRPAMLSLVLLVAVMCFAGMPYSTLLPAVAGKILDGNSETLGTLMAGAGLGALLGALYLASFKGTDGLIVNMGKGAVLFGVGLIGLAFSTDLMLSAGLLMCSAFGMMSILASGNTAIQHLVDDQMRGRVTSLYTLSFFGTVPFGNLVTGWSAAHIGLPLTFAAMGVVALGAAAFFLNASSRITYFNSEKAKSVQIEK